MEKKENSRGNGHMEEWRETLEQKNLKKCQVLNLIMNAVKSSARAKLNLLYTEEDYMRGQR